MLQWENNTHNNSVHCEQLYNKFISFHRYQNNVASFKKEWSRSLLCHFTKSKMTLVGGWKVHVFVSLTEYRNYGEVRPTGGWDLLASLGHPSKFRRVSRLGSVTARHSSSGRQPNFAALNRGRHLYSARRPSRWALAHISSWHSFDTAYLVNVDTCFCLYTPVIILRYTHLFWETD